MTRFFRSVVFQAPTSNYHTMFLPANPQRLRATFILTADMIIGSSDAEINNGAGGYYISATLPVPQLRVHTTDAIYALMMTNASVVRILEEFYAPDQPNTTVVVSGKILKADGIPARGHITFTPSIPSWNELDGVVAGVPIVAHLGIDGSFKVTLQATDDPQIDPTGFDYVVKEFIEGRVPRVFIGSVPLASAVSGLDYGAMSPE